MTTTKERVKNAVFSGHTPCEGNGGFSTIETERKSMEEGREGRGEVKGCRHYSLHEVGWNDFSMMMKIRQTHLLV